MDYRDAIMAPVPRGALPAALGGVRRAAASIPITAMVVARTLMLGNVSRTMVGPILEGIGARQWTNRLMAPMRCVKEPGDDGANMEGVRVIVRG